MASPAAAPPDDITIQKIARQLHSSIQGEVRFDRGSRALYATDGSLYRYPPIGVVIPQCEEDVVRTLAICRATAVPVLARGAGTSLAGQCCNLAVVLDFSKYLNRLIKVNPHHRRARVEPGCVLDVLRNAAEAHHLTFGPDPSTHAHNTLGGMLGNNSCGVHSIMAGRTADNVMSMEVLTYDGLRLHVGPTSEAELEAIIRKGGRRGEIYAGLKRIRDRYADLIRQNYPQIPRRVSGYNLDELLPEKGFNVARALVGSEGTCVTILEAELQLIPSPPVRVLVIMGYDDVYAVGDHVTEILEFGPVGLEGMDSVLIHDMAEKAMHPHERQLLPEGGGWVMVEFGGDTLEEAKAKAQALMDRLQAEDNPPTMAVFDDPAEQERLWKVREAGLGATSRTEDQGDSYPGWEDVAVPPECIGAYLRDFRELMKRHNYAGALYGHFGDGCVHCRINFNLRNEAGLAEWRHFMEKAAELAVSYGGSLSGEHGDGQVRAELLPKMYGPELMEAFRAFKYLWDPLNKMNPGKVIDPYPMTADLRHGPGTRSPLTATTFDYPDDHHSFARAVKRCVGVGNCRDTEGGVMCPSYRGTREEQHSTRGRARLLFEMLHGEERDRGWNSEAVHEALDLCLACKGCKRDCPVDVDMATLKAEFMAHYYQHHLRPRDAFSMGLIWWWSRIATHVPRLANFFLQTHFLATPLKWLGGIAQARKVPEFAAENFSHWFHQRPAAKGDAPAVLLWPDTFNNYFYPNTLKAAVRVLEAAGYRVLIPEQPLCCARPLYAEGMLDLARHQLGKIVDSLEPYLNQRLRIVGVEPSCVTSFRDELPRLLPKDERAHYLAHNTLILSEFLLLIGYKPPPLHQRVLVHTHCHQHASLDAGADATLLGWMEAEAEVLDAGCCGLAGSFGFKAANHALSLRIGEQQLMPSVRKADEKTLIMTNGFSCREQIRQATGRQSFNMAELVAMALDQESTGARVLASSERRIALS